MLAGRCSFWMRNRRGFWHHWNNFVREFRSRYYPATYEEDLDTQNLGQRQHEGEAIDDYVEELQTLMRGRGDFLVSHQLQRLYKNLLPQYKLYIREAEIYLVDDLLKLARQYERIKSEEKSAQQRQWAAKQEEPRPSCTCEKDQKRTTDKAAVVRNRNQLQLELESQFDNRLYTTVEVADHQYRALLDTGAESNYLSLATFASLEAAGCARRTPTERGVILANGTAARLYGKVEINLKVSQEVLPKVMTIMEGLSPKFLFGMQFLQEHRVKIDTGTRTVVWEPQSREKSTSTTQKTGKAGGREIKSGAAAIDMQGKCPQPQETHVFMLVCVRDVWLNALVDTGAESSYVSGEAA
ncbi:uncharacterized protein LOC120352026 [Nilaparvata lugens]|uniref:uncharacterized protein LOC120352026 n=1 Tax=Nilaparvata lugens TaxID=108931 RepID=UPI00193E1D5F|nr:uncharacterized protein LOC120352026 [Nilaparvata lugens]